MKIVQDTIKKINDDFRVDGLYFYKNTSQSIFCVHVNSIVNIGLAEFGYKKLALENTEKIIKSHLFSKKYKLFYSEISEGGKIINLNFNACKNALAALSLFACNKRRYCKKIIKSLYQSPLFNKKTNLFYREFNLKNNFLNPLIIVHTNLLIIFALVKLGNFAEAKKIIRALEASNFDKEKNLFFSPDCKTETKILNQKNFYITNRSYFSDDQGLAVIIYKLLGEKEKAQNLLNNVLDSKLYDKEARLFNRSFNLQQVDKTKTSYKNGILGIALGMMNYKENLDILQKSIVKNFYNSQKKLFNFSDYNFTKIPDNSVISLMAINFDKMKHIIF